MPPFTKLTVPITNASRCCYAGYLPGPDNFEAICTAEAGAGWFWYFPGGPYACCNSRRM